MLKEFNIDKKMSWYDIVEAYNCVRLYIAIQLKKVRSAIDLMTSNVNSNIPHYLRV